MTTAQRDMKLSPAFLNLIPSSRVEAIQRIVEDEKMDEEERAYLLSILIKGGIARRAYGRWKQHREGDRDMDFNYLFRGLPPRAILMAERSLAAQDFDDVAVLLEAGTEESRSVFQYWRARQELDHILKSLNRLAVEDRETVRKVMDQSEEDELVEKVFRCLLKDDSWTVHPADTVDTYQVPYDYLQGAENFEEEQNVANSRRDCRVESTLCGMRRERGSDESDGEEYASDCGDEFDHVAPETHPLTEEDIVSFPDCTNILLLGETGTGKTTFINGLKNYLEYSSLEEAKETGGPEMLIRSVFTYSGDDGEPKKVVTEPKDYKEEDDNEVHLVGDGQSATMTTKSYWIEIGSGDKKMIRLIDTPGMGDTRGMQTDHTNFMNIMKHINEIGSIHAVCVLLRSNMSQPSLPFRQCIDRLMKHLDPQSTSNILFCFTHSRSTGFSPGDALPVLKDQLKEKTQDKDINIELTRENEYSFDNDCLRYLCALRSEIEFPASEDEKYERSWSHDVNETRRLLIHAAALKPRSSILTN